MNGEGYRDPTAEQGNSKRYPPAETDLECGQGRARSPECVTFGVGGDQNERSDNRKRTQVGR